MNEPVSCSIIINNYNYGRFLGEAIESALAQTYPHVEVIVVDDGSTDNSREVIASHGNRIFPVLKENGGQASAFNAGFAASKGELVFFLDSDDMLLPTAVDAVVSKWRDDLARAYFPLEIIDATGQPQGRLAGGSVVPNHVWGPFGVGSPTSGNAFSRKVLHKITPIPEAEWRICADSYLVAASSLQGRSELLGQPLGKYRVHGKNNFEGAKPSLAATRQQIRFIINLHAVLHRLASERIGPFEDWLATYPQHWVARITSLRESPHDHPWPDTLPGLIRRAIGATWRHPYWNLRRKLAYTTFALSYGLSPSAVRHALKRAEESMHSRAPRLLLGSKPSDEEIRRSATP